MSVYFVCAQIYTLFGNGKTKEGGSSTHASQLGVSTDRENREFSGILDSLEILGENSGKLCLLPSGKIHSNIHSKIRGNESRRNAGSRFCELIIFKSNGRCGCRARAHLDALIAFGAVEWERIRLMRGMREPRHIAV